MKIAYANFDSIVQWKKLKNQCSFQQKLNLGWNSACSSSKILGTSATTTTKRTIDELSDVEVNCDIFYTVQSEMHSI